MEKETTYRKIAETRYTFTEDDIKWALITYVMGDDPGPGNKFSIIHDPDIGYSAQIVVERTVDLDDSGIVHELT